MWFPDPIYKALPYIYFIIGILVGISMRPSIFSIVSAIALFIGGTLVLFMRYSASKEDEKRSRNKRKR